MSRMVIYTSSTGFTKQYAEWIAEELHCEACRLKETTQGMIDAQDQI